MSAFNFFDPLSHKLYAAFMFDGRNCQELIRQATAGVHPQTSITESIAGYFQKWKFGPKFNGGFGTFYSVSLPDAGHFTFNDALIPDSGIKGDLAGEITLVWRGSLRDDGNTLTGGHIIGKHASNGATNNPFSWIWDHGGNPSFTITRANSAFAQQQSPFNVSFDENYTIGYNAGRTIEGTNYYFKDGQRFTANLIGGSGTGQANGSGNSNIQIGRRPDNVFQHRGRNERILIYTRLLSPTEHWQLHDDPDIIFQEDDYAIGLTESVGATIIASSSSVRFSNTFVRADQFFQAGARFVSSFAVVESRGAISSSIRFTSQFTPCIASDIYGQDAGDANRYRR